MKNPDTNLICLYTNLYNVAFLHTPAVGGPGLLDSGLETEKKEETVRKKKCTLFFMFNVSLQ